MTVRVQLSAMFEEYSHAGRHTAWLLLVDSRFAWQIRDERVCLVYRTARVSKMTNQMHEKAFGYLRFYDPEIRPLRSDGAFI